MDGVNQTVSGQTRVQKYNTQSIIRYISVQVGFSLLVDPGTIPGNVSCVRTQN